LRLCLSFLLSLAEAEDAAQEAFLKGFVSINSYKEDISFQAWMSRIASNHCLDLLRKRKRQKTDSLDGFLEHSEESADWAPQTTDEPSAYQMDAREKSAFALKALSELSASQRQILALRELDGLRYDEIAKVLGCTLDGVKARLRRAREALQARARHFSNESSVMIVGANQ
jgi:RNA polymerase sigma-70 factor (ECF subfamily)